MSMKSLRDLVELEGRNGSLDEIFDSSGSSLPSIRQLIVLAVRTMYRPARARLRSSIPEEQMAGRNGMRQFAAIMEIYANFALDDQDFSAKCLALHNAASANGFLGEDGKHRQNFLNNLVFGQLSTLGPDIRNWNEDEKFVCSKVFWGLMENDSEFAKTASFDDWREHISILEKERYPDFPGRALMYTKKLHAAGVLLTDADNAPLLERAGTCEFGKEDQKNDVREYYRLVYGRDIDSSR